MLDCCEATTKAFVHARELGIGDESHSVLPRRLSEARGRDKVSLCASSAQPCWRTQENGPVSLRAPRSPLTPTDPPPSPAEHAVFRLSHHRRSSSPVGTAGWQGKKKQNINMKESSSHHTHTHTLQHTRIPTCTRTSPRSV